MHNTHTMYMCIILIPYLIDGDNLKLLEVYGIMWITERMVLCMDFLNLFNIFKERCVSVQGFVRTKYGRNLFLVAVAVFVLLFFAPLFQGAVGAALIGCVAAPLTVMVWRRHDKRHCIVPAVFLCIPMILDMIIYHTLSIAVCMLVAIVATLAVSMHPGFEFVIKIQDSMYAYLAAGGVCAAVVAIASLLILLVSIAWWLFCLLLFFAVIAIFFTVVLSTAAYTATDVKRQQRKKQKREENADAVLYDYDLDTFAQDIGLINETDPDVKKSVQNTAEVPRVSRRPKSEQLYYDVDE